MHKIRTIFLLLVLTQGLHSIEEYIGHLWEVFPPAKYLTGLVSADRRLGFIIINAALFLFGLWCFFFPVRKGYVYSGTVIWFWIVIELINGIGHPVWSFYKQAYTPGVATAPFLFLLSIYLIVLLSKQHSIPTNTP